MRCNQRATVNLPPPTIQASYFAHVVLSYGWEPTWIFEKRYLAHEILFHFPRNTLLPLVMVVLGLVGIPDLELWSLLLLRFFF